MPSRDQCPFKNFEFQAWKKTLEGFCRNIANKKICAAFLKQFRIGYSIVKRSSTFLASYHDLGW